MEIVCRYKLSEPQLIGSGGNPNTESCLTRLRVDKQNSVLVSEAGQNIVEEILVSYAELWALRDRFLKKLHI